MQNFNERMEKWRRLLEAAKPEGWKWQPPEEIEPPTPKEPPENIKSQLDDLIAKLPNMEEAILRLKLIGGLSSEEIAQMLGSKKVFVTVIEQGAVKRLAEMVGSNENEIYSWLEWWGKKKVEAIEAETANLPSRQPSPDCPSLDRLYVAHLRWDWTEQERQHIRSCEYCRFMAKKIRERIWHPSSAQLWKYVTEGDLRSEERLDIRYHLETDNCRRCRFIMEKVLNPIVSLLERARLAERGEFSFSKPAAEREVPYSLVLQIDAHRFEVSRMWAFAQLTVAASSVPVALSVEGFAGEVQEEVRVEEGSFRAQLKREPEGWVARVETKDVPADSKALFSWFTTDGVEKIRYEAEFKHAYENCFYAEAIMATEREQLGEGYFVVALLPPVKGYDLP